MIPGSDDILDLAPPPALPIAPEMWWWWLLFAVVVALGLISIYGRRRRAHPTGASALAVARAELLELSILPITSSPDDVATREVLARASTVVRRYLATRYGVSVALAQHELEGLQVEEREHTALSLLAARLRDLDAARFSPHLSASVGDDHLLPLIRALEHLSESSHSAELRR